SLVRKLPEAVAVSAPSAAGSSASPLPSAPAPARHERRTPEPLGQQRYKIQFTAGRELCDKLREAQALLRQQIPDGELAEIFNRALTLLVEDLKRKKFAQTSRPAKRRQTSGDGPSRHIPAEIKRAVYARDGGSCAFVGRSGRRCGVRDRLELHHLDPWARSASHSVTGIELRCQQHTTRRSATSERTTWRASGRARRACCRALPFPGTVTEVHIVARRQRATEISRPAPEGVRARSTAQRGQRSGPGA
ncbi:MAG: hypothetical protein V3V67_14820, partial [Myxococcota bacterium]